MIEANKKQFGLDNVEALHREAPDGLEELPAPDVVLIGGSGKHLNAILETVTEKLVPGGRVVLNCITLQTVMTLFLSCAAMRIFTRTMPSRCRSAACSGSALTIWPRP